MKKPFWLLGVASILCLAGLAVDQAKARVYIVHGLPGIDAGAADPALPVDIALNGSCAVRNLKYKGVYGPVEVDAGIVYDVEVLPANADAPCSGTPEILSLTGVTFEAGKTYAVVAHLNKDGGKVLGKFEVGLRPTPPVRLRRNPRSMPRVHVFHTAGVGAVDIALSRQSADNQGNPGVRLEAVENGMQASADLRSGSWIASVVLNDSRIPLYGPYQVMFDPFLNYFIFAFGTMTNASFDVFIHPLGSKAHKGVDWDGQPSNPGRGKGVDRK